MKIILIGVLVLTSVSAFAVDFDQIAFEKSLKIALDKADVSTDLYLACSDSGKVKTEELIQSIKEKAIQLPVKNSLEVAASLEASYRSIFDCEKALKKALFAGFSEEEIYSAINRIEARQNDLGESSFDMEGFEKNLKEVLSRIH